MEQDKDLLARTIYGEARSDGWFGMAAVANVIMNRARQGGWWGDSVETVIRKRLQFSMWNADQLASDNTQQAINATEADPWFKQALEIADLAIAGTLPDNTGGATHYHTKYVSPSWADETKVTARIGDHIFYEGLG